jgi:Cu2+-exporting ATPase
MMQVMMYALPPYVSTDITAKMLSLLRWAAWVLTLPVMFFSADVFTAAAWRDLKRGDKVEGYNAQTLKLSVMSG